MFLPFIALLASGCNNTPVEEENVRWVSPLGAPSLVFFDQGNNKDDWVSQKAALMPAELQGNAYDAVIFDATTGLSAIKKNNSDFALAKVITAGNMYLVGLNKDTMPTSEDKIVAFQKDKIPDKVFKKLASDRWNLDVSNAKYVSDASETAPILQSGKYQGETVDYVLTAEPVFQSSKLTALQNGITLTEIKSLRSEWKALTNQDAIVQAGIFVRKSSLETKKEKLKVWMNMVDTNLNKLISNDAGVKEAMDAYGDIDAQKTRFGVPSQIASKVQENGNNRLAFISASLEESNVNGFLSSLGEATYEDTYFVNI